MCAVQKRERAPPRKAAEDVYGAERMSTVQEGCGRCVRCEKVKVHRTGKLRKMCTVRKGESAPYRKVAENVCGAKR